MALLEVIEAVTKVFDLFNAVVDTVKNVREFFEDPDEENRRRYESTIEEIIRSRDELLDASATILSAIQQLDQTIFRERMSDKMGDLAQAEQALDNFLRTGDAVQRSAALDGSAGAMADLLQYVNDGTYPVEAILINLVEALPRRMMILKQADSGFCLSAVAMAPLKEAIRRIRDTANLIETAILSANQIGERTFTRRRVVILPRSLGGGRETITTLVFSIRYKNVLGTSTFSGETTTEDGDRDPDFVEAIERLREAANAARLRGLADDTNAAAIALMRSVAEVAETTLSRCEAGDVISLVSNEPLRFAQRAEFSMARRTLSLKQATLQLLQSSKQPIPPVIDVATSEADVLRLSKGLIDRPLTDAEQDALVAVHKAFGSAQVASVLLNLTDSRIK
jgi:hypothetical protein